MADKFDLPKSEKTIRVALVHQADAQAGGAATYESYLSDLLRKIASEAQFELLEFHPSAPENSPSEVLEMGQAAGSYFYSKNLLTLVYSWALASIPGWRFLAERFLGKNTLEDSLLLSGVSVVYFSSPNPLALGFSRIPIITTVWDLGHRDLPQFPEFSSRGRWLAREYYFQKTLRASSAVVTDSESTGEKLERIYRVRPESWISIGLLPKIVQPSENFELVPKTPYVIYPAQKWRHKNHAVLYRALKILRDSGVEILLVETGSDKGYQSKLDKLSKKLGVEDLVLDAGFVDKRDLALLIKNSKGLVMPSRLGPTNLPPLEGLALGVPVAVSDVHKFDEDVAELVIFCGIDSPEEWAEAMRKMTQNRAPQVPQVSFDNLEATEKLRQLLTRVVVEN